MFSKIAGVPEKRVVVTLARGAVGRRLAGISHGLMRDYAESVRADFTTLMRPAPGQLGETDSSAKKIFFGKLLIKDLFQSYDRLLFVDSDVLITPGSPDIFSEVPVDHLGATRVDTLPPEFAPAIREGWFKDEMALIQQEFGDIAWREPYYNSGVMVLSTCHKELVDRCAATAVQWAANPQRFFGDQTLLNYWTFRLGFALHDLGETFNHTRPFNGEHHRFESYFLHYAGPRGHRRGNRFRQMNLDRWILERPPIHSFLRDHRRIASVLDWLFPLPEKLVAPWRVFHSSPNQSRSAAGDRP